MLDLKELVISLIVVSSICGIFVFVILICIRVFNDLDYIFWELVKLLENCDCL